MANLTFGPHPTKQKTEGRSSIFHTSGTWICCLACCFEIEVGLGLSSSLYLNHSTRQSHICGQWLNEPLLTKPQVSQCSQRVDWNFRKMTQLARPGLEDDKTCSFKSNFTLKSNSSYTKIFKVVHLIMHVWLSVCRSFQPSTQRCQVANASTYTLSDLLYHCASLVQGRLLYGKRLCMMRCMQAFLRRFDILATKCTWDTEQVKLTSFQGSMIVVVFAILYLSCNLIFSFH